MVRRLIRCLFVAALAFPIVGIAAENGAAPARPRNFSPWPVIDKAQSCNKYFQTCTNFCDKAFDLCNGKHDLGDLWDKCVQPYRQCRTQCGNNRRLCTR